MLSNYLFFFDNEHSITYRLFKMQRTELKLNEIFLVGITVRTNNRNEENWMSGKIFPCVLKYFNEKLFEKIHNRKNPGRTFCVYTEYESDYNGDYTYFIGEEVTSFNLPLEGELKPLTIKPQKYVKFTTEPGPMPDVLKNAWQAIWKMSDADFGSPRHYYADFEIYDERAKDHNNLVLDLYIGIK